MQPLNPNPTLATGSSCVPEGTIAQNSAEAVKAAERSQASIDLRLPTIPGYEILGELGRGGSGVVYRARHILLNRPTAIKMLLGGQFVDTVGQVRFLVEAEVVALIQHPNVVQVFEFGQCDGQPFFALEFVDGGTLAGKLHEEGRYAPRAAAEMIAKLADAIAAAHAKGIVHRDLKPANVLLDRSGEPKVTDFGLAKVGQSEMTDSGAIMGTPNYMSPEQAAGRTKEIGTATDVYTLGVILYELLTGRTPFKGESVMETIQLVLAGAAAWPRTVVRAIPRDLETICLKCLEREPRKRYRTAEALAADLRAYLDGRPIAVRPIGTVEIAIKWARRQPTLAALFLVSILGVCGIVWKYVEAEEHRKIAEAKSIDAENQKIFAQQQQLQAEQSRLTAEEQRKDAERQKGIAETRRKDAEEQRETALAVSQFLMGLFEDADPISLTGRMFGSHKRSDGVVTAAEIVDRAALKLKTSLTDQPRTRAALLDCIGDVYLDQARPQVAEPLLREALKIRREQFGDDHLDTAMSWQSIGALHICQGEMEAAGKDFEKALAVRRKHLGNTHKLVGDSLFYLGTQRLILSEYRDAERLLNECLAIRRSQGNPESREIALTLLLLGLVYFHEDEAAKAFPLMTESATILDKIGGKNDFSGIVSLFIKAQFMEKVGSVKKARELYEEADARATKLLGSDHYLLVTGRIYFANFLGRQGDNEASAKIRRNIVETYRKAFGPDCVIVANKLLDLARSERELRRIPEAMDASRDAVRIYRKHLTESQASRARLSEALHVLGAMHYNRGELAEGHLMYREALTLRIRGEIDDDRTHMIARDMSQRLLDGENRSVSAPFIYYEKLTGNAKSDFEIAKTWAQAAVVFQRQCPKPTPDDELNLRYLQMKAISVLRAAVDAGLRDVKAIEDFPEFKPLQDIPEFQKLLKEIPPSPPE